MLRALSVGPTRMVASRATVVHSFHSSSFTAAHHPNAPLELDPSFQALLNDVDLSLLRHRKRPTPLDPKSANPPVPRELEMFADEGDLQDDYLTTAELDSQDGALESKEKRRSPAALFGSKRFGAIALPYELQNSVMRLIADSDKAMLHVDAKRLFASEQPEDVESEWDTSYSTQYRSRRAAMRHEGRDGAAFASIALPAHYSAVYAVLDHVKQRLGPVWNVEHVVDWGASTGSALWASLYSFQKQHVGDNDLMQDDPRVANTSIASYLAVDKRDGLVNIGKKLLEGNQLDTIVSWKRSYYGAAKPVRTNGEILAVSAFMMSALPTPLARKTMVKEMWESGADTIILIDHNSHAGFSNIAEAREFLLKQGRNDSETPNEDTVRAGCHVLAPCPHDGACPIYFSGSRRFVCGFNQRLQRPEFLRRTKHSGVGHEDIGYSYVVVRRGPRPAHADTKLGRIGEVGRRELVKEILAQAPKTELVLDGEELAAHQNADEYATSTSLAVAESTSPEALETALRLEAYSWPRLVFPPLKRAGHIILDACTEDGKVMRMTVPKSQGKQPFYDARKSDWGDIFPHDPKNRPQTRFEAQKLLRPRSSFSDVKKMKKRDTLDAMVNSESEKEKGRVRRERKLARMERDGL